MTSFFSWIFISTATFLPLIFLPVTQDFYDTTKWIILVYSAFIFLLVGAWQFARTAKIHLSIRPFTIGLFIMTLASSGSVWFASVNKIEALLHPFGPITFAALTLLSLTASSLWDTHMSRRFLWMMCVSASILGLIAVYQAMGVGKIMFPTLSYLADPLWTPTGSSTATLSILIIMLPLMVQGIREGRKHGHDTHFILFIIMTIVTLAGIGTTLWHLVPKLATLFLSPKEGWIVLLEILKTPRQALVGVGVENFLSAFTAGRPARLNLTPLWTARFTTNSNFFFHMTTVYGIVGLTALLVFVRHLLSRVPKDALFVSLVLGSLSLLVVPPNISLFIIIVGLGIASHTTPLSHSEHTIRTAGWIRGSIFTLCLVAVVVSGYFIGRAYAAEMVFAQAMKAAAANDGTKTYNLHIKAMELNPYIVRFHTSYSQTNLSLAVALSSTIAQLPDATEEEKTANRNLVAQLVQQSIREGKIAVNLNKSSILAWENLARIYQQLIGVAQDSDKWAVTTYEQAILLDPYNPLLALELGGVYVQMKNYTDAITQFTRSTNLKPDYANAWYNLGNAYRLSGDTTLAVKAFEKAQTFLLPESSEYRIISEELSSIQNRTQPPQDAPESSTLTTPTPAPIAVPQLDVSN